MAETPDFLGFAQRNAMLDFSPISDAIGQYQKNQMLQQERAFRERQFTEGQRQFNASNSIAEGRFGLEQKQNARAEGMAPLQLRQLEAEIQNLRQKGASEAQLAPLTRAHVQATTELAQAQAKAAGTKDVFNEALAGVLKDAMPPKQGAPAIGGQPQQPPAQQPAPNPIRPQSLEGGPGANPVLIPTQAADGPEPINPMLIQAQAADGPPPVAQPRPDTAAPPNLVDTPMGKMPLDQAKKLGFVLALGGKGDAGKLFTDAANTDHLGKTAQGEVQKDMVGLTGTIGRLEAIEKRFDPKFLEIPKRAGLAWAGLKDKFGAMSDENIAKMSPAARDEALKQKSELTRYTQFRQSSVQNAALYVKYLSGVAVSEQEYERIMKTLPNAGTSIADGDSPTEFQAKMKESVTQAKMAYARAHYLNTQGFKGKPWEAGVALDDVRGIIDQRGAQIEQELQGRVPPERMQGAVRQKLKQEFGI